jgi:hypothetical protein
MAARTMSILRRGDQDLHYSDNSHRWIAPPDIEQGAWNAGMRAHLDQHVATMGGPTKEDEIRACGPVRIPRQRRPRDAAATVLRPRPRSRQEPGAA